VIVGIFGLGEAGSLFAADLVGVGVRVQAFDPKPVSTPAEVVRCENPADAVRGAQLVLALTPQDDAVNAFMQAVGAFEPGALYADLSTSAPAVKREIAAQAAEHGVEFVDVALMAVVLGNGLRAPALVSGDGADRYVAVMAPFGVPVESVGATAGEAATRKLLRSVMMKGLAATVIEAMRAAEKVGLEHWLWSNLVDEITAADEVLLARLVKGTGIHAVRRLHEMEACQSLLESLGVDPVMTRSTVESLRRVPAEGVPVVPPPA
jgi:3-hydroxyisobutyrate dehydrogenase-like beta-hydroxyacid dehydrogenase